ncbi:flagellar biosynthesis regulator FlhF [Pontibacillus chungwhensis BH030062]|uniref:Flagellar biosynthesis protein FlhF n=1 Tax=Pontibacillus chungwhensis BH030062 TaxID=1385513 RepID=A0A0A2UY96_9BACI|nr:flagellar biosynthesis protein FlhF [Pontibacillus chungwhensis]KGP92874.1 flagellar biosynthesis regulator FlhF [Pontibacillus chungwhensis BH030062]
MKVKKYRAPTMPEVMKQVRSELGAEAVILNSKEIHKGGFLGMFKKKSIEVVAAIDPEPKRDSEQTYTMQTIQRSGSISKEKPTDQGQNVYDELQELKKLMKTQSTSSPLVYPGVLQKLYNHLINQEVSERLAKRLIDPLVEHYYVAKGNVDVATAKEWLKERLSSELEGIPFGGIDFSKKYIHLVGPTGVGKTTSLAKIAAESVLSHQKRVAFITTDTFRIAAIDQLKTYAKILDVPIEVAYNLDDYKKAKEKFSDYDLVLVDTAGRNFKDEKYVQELKETVDFEEELETYLVLSITSKATDIEEIYKQFNSVPLKRLIFTKVDETSHYGVMFNMMMKFNIGVAYLTDGQNVPDDIREASSKSIVSKLVGGLHYE